jgi:hypothetical protein
LSVNPHKNVTYVTIHKQTVDQGQGPEVWFVVPAVAFDTPEGKQRVPNPVGTETLAFKTLEDAQAAIRRAGFDFMYEGKKTSALGDVYGKSLAPSTIPASVWDLATCVPPLLALLEAREPSVIVNAAFALGELQDVPSANQAVEPLIGLLSHEDSHVRKAVTDALAKLTRHAVPQLLNAYDAARKSTDKTASTIRLSVMQTYNALVQTQGPDSLKDRWGRLLSQAAQALDDPSWLVRAQAALVIGHAARWHTAEPNTQAGVTL